MKRIERCGPCPVMRTCGGCELLGLPYLKQLRRKQAAVEELFAPLQPRGGQGFPIDPVRGMGGDADGAAALPAPRRFRCKATTPFAPGPNGSVRAGLFARGSHRIIPVPDCAVEVRGARSILNSVAGIAERCRIPAYDEDRRRGLLRYAVLRLGWRTDEGILTMVTSERAVPGAEALSDGLSLVDPRITTIALNVNSRMTNAILGPETSILSGPPRMRDRLLDCVFEISPTAFYQTNPSQTETLYRTAIEHLALRDGEVLLDAYCGSGTIGLCCAASSAARRDALTLIGVERNRAGVADARRNAALNGLDGAATFIEADATAWLGDAIGRGAHVDALVLDPPRAGSTPRFLEAAAALGPRCIVYISCNPETQVRDLATLLDAGYRIQRVSPVDLFAHTTHIETIVSLTR